LVAKWHVSSVITKERQKGLDDNCIVEDKNKQT